MPEIEASPWCKWKASWLMQNTIGHTQHEIYQMQYEIDRNVCPETTCLWKGSCPPCGEEQKFMNRGLWPQLLPCHNFCMQAVEHLIYAKSGRPITFACDNLGLSANFTRDIRGSNQLPERVKIAPQSFLERSKSHFTRFGVAWCICFDKPSSTAICMSQGSRIHDIYITHRLLLQMERPISLSTNFWVNENMKTWTDDVFRHSVGFGAVCLWIYACVCK